ncbi:unnamed protein product [Miscanthus lutarioriparius]|uniref:Uncharacterized protein n=1 Tax=Miscanthus lutarioriparius TaxID=422564 RepID=A0A811S7V1_9POAL|nr:unnamed protein product [Miscanthus lutarioriparius]
MGVLTLVHILISFAACAEALRRADFPQGFVFGTASSAYKYEGAVNEGQRGPTIWDTLETTRNADIAVDHYHRYKHSILCSLSFFLLDGTGDPNEEGLNYYNSLIDVLLDKGIQPYVTLFHWDLPQALEDRYGGWLNSQIVDDFVHYASTCFTEFGDRVKHWITFIEPHNFAIDGYDFGIQAPGRCSILSHIFCREGKSSTEPYVVAHNILIAHAGAFHSYKQQFKKEQGGIIGIALDSKWFLDPLMFGHYPPMQKLAGDRLPQFSTQASKLVSGSLDFVGINHYTTLYVRNDRMRIRKLVMNDASTDSAIIPTAYRHGKKIGETAASGWLHIVPWGMFKLMKYIKEMYGNPPVIITENGRKAATSTVTSYGHCSITGSGTFVYTVRFGLYYIDYNNNLTKIPKASVEWFRQVLAQKTANLEYSGSTVAIS